MSQRTGSSLVDTQGICVQGPAVVDLMAVGVEELAVEQICTELRLSAAAVALQCPVAPQALRVVLVVCESKVAELPRLFPH